MESHQQTPLTTQTPAISKPENQLVFVPLLVYYASLLTAAAGAAAGAAEMLHHTAIWFHWSFVDLLLLLLLLWCIQILQPS